MIKNDINQICYFYLTIDKTHYKIKQNKEIIQDINVNLSNIENKINTINLQKNFPFRYCLNTNFKSEIDDNLTLNKLE